MKLRYVVKYKMKKMAKSLLKDHDYCPMLLMQTTKTAVCLQTKAIFRHLYFNCKMYWCSSLISCIILYQ